MGVVIVLLDAPEPKVAPLAYAEAGALVARRLEAEIASVATTLRIFFSPDIT